MQVHRFGAGSSDSSARDRAIAGNKGAGLAIMSEAGIPVPPGFIIDTSACRAYYVGGRRLQPSLEREVDEALAWLERVTGKTLGHGPSPLLLAVRSGAAASMPGMMETILNLGMNDEVAEALATATGDRAFARDCHRRFLQMFGEVALGIPSERFAGELEQARRLAGAATDIELGADGLARMVERFRAIVRQESGVAMIDVAREQLNRAIASVFESWTSERALAYRTRFGLTGLDGTAVTVQAMVFGNLGDDSAAGVCFTRDPATGARELFGEYLPRAQGEEVVAGTRDPLPIAVLRERAPELHAELERTVQKLESLFGDMQDIELTIERGKLFVLQTRAGKRTARAALVIATDLVDEARVDADRAYARIDAEALEHLLHPELDPVGIARAESERRLLGSGLSAGPGAGTGRIALTAARALEYASHGGRAVLLRTETAAEDISGMIAAEAMVTARGGASSHAAVVARQLGKPCVVGCTALQIDEPGCRVVLGARTIEEGQVVTVDGSSGRVYLGEIATVPSAIARALEGGALDPAARDLHQRYERVMQWADSKRRLGIRANCDDAASARNALALGAEGIGLCRTEHMFFAPDRIEAFQQLILMLASARDEALDKPLAALRSMQEDDFAALFRVMAGRPVTIRLLDPPLHEFLPREAAARERIAIELGLSREEVERRINRLVEDNPMLGIRGCRLGVVHPIIYEMQVEALVAAAARVAGDGIAVELQIMIPLVSVASETAWLSERIRTVIERVATSLGRTVPCRLGTMIETPRAALTAGEIASVTEFFSFGTNDLTQMTFGLSRDDTAELIAAYLGRDRQLLAVDPFRRLDEVAVGRLVALAVREGRAARPTLEVGVCGEHGGDPQSIAFCHRAGLDYVSTNPSRLPVARLAAAQAALAAFI
jgi:pyruvate,orthophosphate dikinase